MIHIIGPKDPQHEGAINVTSHSSDFGKALSPFLLGPIPLYGGRKAEIMEGAWQFCKVYPQHLDSKDEPNQTYWVWAEAGRASRKPMRYPMGKGAKPWYSWWAGEKLGYIAARKKIYCPLYAAAIETVPALQQLRDMHAAGKDLWLWDFDGYNHRAKEMSYRDVVNNEKRSLGHAFVIAMVIENDLAWIDQPEPELVPATASPTLLDA